MSDKGGKKGEDDGVADGDVEIVSGGCVDGAEVVASAPKLQQHRTVSMSVADLVKAKSTYNPRQITQEQFEKLKRSIERFGVVEPLVFNERTKRLVGGHQRVDALHALGVDFVPCVLVDIGESEERALNIALNRISGDWQFDKLTELLRSMDDDLVALTGMAKDEVSVLLNTGTTFSYQRAELTRTEFDYHANKENEENKENEGGGSSEERARLVSARKFNVLVETADETQQAALMDRLEKDGFKCKPLVM